MANTIILNYTGLLSNMNFSPGNNVTKSYSISGLQDKTYITKIEYYFNISNALSNPTGAKFTVTYAGIAKAVNITNGMDGGPYSVAFNISEFPQIKNLTNGDSFDVKLRYSNSNSTAKLWIANAHLKITYEYNYAKLSTPVLSASSTVLQPDSNTVYLTWSESNSTEANFVEKYQLYIDGNSQEFFINSDSELTCSLTVKTGEIHFYQIKAISNIEGYDSQLSNSVEVKCYDVFKMPELEVYTYINSTKISSADNVPLYVGESDKPIIYAEWNLDNISTKVDTIEKIIFAGITYDKNTKQAELESYDVGNLQLEILMTSGQSGTKSIEIREIESPENYSLRFLTDNTVRPETNLEVSWEESYDSNVDIKEIRYLRTIEIIKNENPIEVEQVEQVELPDGTSNETINLNNIVDYNEKFIYSLTPRFYAEYGGYTEGDLKEIDFTRSSQPEITVSITSDINELPDANYALKQFKISLSGQGGYKNISIYANNQKIYSENSIDDFKSLQYDHNIEAEAFNDTEIIYKIVATTSLDRTSTLTYPSYYKYQPPKITLNANSIVQTGSAPNVKVNIRGTTQDKFGLFQDCSYRLSMSYEDNGYKELITGDVTSGELIIDTQNTLKVKEGKIIIDSEGDPLYSLYQALTTWEGNKLKVSKPTVKFKIDLWDDNIGEFSSSFSVTKEYTLDYSLAPSNVSIEVSNPKELYSSDDTLTFTSSYEIIDLLNNTKSFQGTVKQTSPVVIEDVGTSYTFGLIQDDTNYEFKAVARFEYSDGTVTRKESSGTVSVEVCRHVPPTVQVYNLGINDNKKLEGNVLIIPNGSKDKTNPNKNLSSYVLYIYDENNNNFFVSEPSEINGTQIEIDIKKLSYSQTFEKDSNHSFRFKVLTQAGNSSTSSQETIVYVFYRPANVPLSIRKGRIGINVAENFGKTNDKTGSALQVNETSINTGAIVEIISPNQGDEDNPINFFKLSNSTNDNSTNDNYIKWNGKNIIIDNLLVEYATQADMADFSSKLFIGDDTNNLSLQIHRDASISSNGFTIYLNDTNHPSWGLTRTDESNVVYLNSYNNNGVHQSTLPILTPETDDWESGYALVSLDNCKIGQSKITSSELDCLSGISDNIQTQIDDITQEIQPIERGGTGALTAGAANGAALYNLGIIYNETQPSNPYNGLIWLKPKE